MKIIINPWVKDFIEKTPQISRSNACGWLIGFRSSSDQIVILSALIASRYLETEYNYRIPDPSELDELMQIIPSNLQIIGIFHFKPGSQLKITSKAGNPEKFYKIYSGKIICVTNIESTKFYQLSNTEHSEMDTYYHEIPENLMKSLVILFNFSLTTEINLKLSYLPQVLSDITSGIDTALQNNSIVLHKSSIIAESLKSSKPYIFKNGLDSLFDPKTILKDDEPLSSLLQSKISSLTNPETYLSMHISINTISNEEEIQKRDKFTKHLGAYGSFIVPCVVLLNLQQPQMPEDVISTLITQLKGELTYKISRSMIKYSHNRNGLLILPPESHLLQYKNVLLNVKTHLKKVDIVKKQFELELVENLLDLSYFSQNTLPDIEEAFFREDDKLIMYRQKFSALGKLTDKSLGVGLLQALEYIHKERGQIESIKEVQRLASSL